MCRIAAGIHYLSDTIVLFNNCFMPRDEFCHSSDHAFQLLFEAYRNRVYGYVLAISHSNYVAEELTQEVFIKLWLCRDILHQVEHPESYIFAIARHKTLNHLRKAGSDSKLLNELKDRMTPEYNNVDQYLFGADCDKLLKEAVARLSPQRRIVYDLSRSGGLNHEQIASHLHLSRNTVKNHLVEALRFIRSYLGQGALILLIRILSD
jgi:RNA polymerase sigma-70 factor (ECF subfamily)